MGRRWNAAEREEGYQLGAGASGLFVTAVDIVTWTSRATFRYFSGRPLLGDQHRKTDATFWHDATRQLRKNDRPAGRWSKLAEWKRAAIRTGLFIELVAIPWAWYGSGPYAFIAALVAVIVAGNAAWLIWYKSSDYLRNWRHNREVVRPMQAGLAPVFGINPNQVRVKLPPPRRGKAS